MLYENRGHTHLVEVVSFVCGHLPVMMRYLGFYCFVMLVA
jgi:hypothetical protein